MCDFHAFALDHRQGLGGQGNHSTHCLPKAVPVEQALVLLLMISVGDDEQGSLLQPFKQQAGVYSQFQVFPTLLTLLGYSLSPEEHGVDLSQSWNQPTRVFYQEIFLSVVNCIKIPLTGQHNRSAPCLRTSLLSWADKKISCPVNFYLPLPIIAIALANNFVLSLF